MTQTPFDLDTAIDTVAKQLTHVEHDPHLSVRIAASLPERSSWLGWWAPRLAMIAVVVAAGILWANREPQATPGVSPLASSQPIATPLVLAAAVREAQPNSTRPVEFVEPLQQVEPALDFDRALPPIEALASLELESLAADSLPEDAPLTVAPLAIIELPLTPDSVSQQE